MTRASDDDRIDLRVLIWHLWIGRWWILSVLVLFTGVATVAAFTITPFYRASAVLVAATSDKGGGGILGAALGQLGGLASVAGLGGMSGDSQSQEALAVLVSREFTEDFIRDNNLMQQLFASRWDASARRWQGEKKDWPTLSDGFRFFDKRVRSVAKNKETGLVTMSIDWRDPNRAAAWANALVDRLNSEMRSRAIARTTDSLQYLDKELAATFTVETRQAISRLVEGQVNQRMLANVTHDYAFRFVDRALPSDIDDEVWPNKPMFLIVGFMLGLLLGSGGVILVRTIRAQNLRS